MSEGNRGYDDTPMEKIHQSNKYTRSVQFLLPYIAVLATLYTVYFAKTILLPIVIAIFLSLLSSPAVNYLERRYVPRSLAAVLIICVILCLLGSISVLLTLPAQDWWQRIPEVIGMMADTVDEATKSIGDMAGEVKSTQAQVAVNSAEATISTRDKLSTLAIDTVTEVTPVLVTQILATIFLTYFFLVYGHFLLLGIVQNRSTFSDKRHSVEVVNQMQEKLAKYLSTITLVNIGLGIAVTLAFWALGMEDPYLWGSMATVLNFIPYLGPMVAASVFAIAGFVQADTLTYALMISGTYLCINLMECQFVTPKILGDSLDINPLVVFVWLLVWGWLWGGLGMLVAVPLLVCTSIYLEDSGVIGEWHRLLKHKTPTAEGQEEPPPLRARILHVIFIRRFKKSA